jgi:PTH2 family peptidyl-tRNA hydrolase
MISTFVLFPIGAVLGFVATFLFNRLRGCRSDAAKQPREDKTAAFRARVAFPEPSECIQEPKFVIGVRTDIKLTDAETAALAAQIVVQAVDAGLPAHAGIISQWFYFNQAKICTKVPSRDEMASLIDRAGRAHLNFATIMRGGEVVVIGVGPGPIEAVNEVTGHLKLR